MKNLSFGCKRSDFLVTNSNEDWFIQCRFYEPDREKPFTYRRRLNRFKTEKERNQIEKLLLKQMTELLDEKDYNPRTKEYMFERGNLNPYLFTGEALQKALDKKDFTVDHSRNVKLHLDRFMVAFEKNNLNYLKIKDVELIHVKQTLESLNLSNYTYNKFRVHLSSLFTDLVDEGCIKVNPCTGIKPKKHIVEKREIFTIEELKKIDKHIKNKHPHFYNYFQIFFMSGCRTTEILTLKKTDVNIDRAEFTITLKKGQLYVREKRAIISDALPFWKDQLQNAIFDDDYIFSYFYQPGDHEMNRNLVYRFWKEKVMVPLKIDKSIYCLKHTFLDMVEEANFSAQIMAGHRDDRTTSLYTVGREKRRLEAQKLIQIKTF
jgi:integrase